MMGVLPCQFKEGTDAATLKLDGTETFDLSGLESGPVPRQDASLTIRRRTERRRKVLVTLGSIPRSRSSTTGTEAFFLYVLRQILGFV